MAQVREQAVLDVLGRSIHPSFNLPVTALHMVRAVRVAPGAIEVDLVLNCAGCPGPQALLARLRKDLQALDPEGAVRIAILPEEWKPPWEADE